MRCTRPGAASTTRGSQKGRRRRRRTSYRFQSGVMASPPPGDRAVHDGTVRRQRDRALGRSVVETRTRSCLIHDPSGVADGVRPVPAGLRTRAQCAPSRARTRPLCREAELVVARRPPPTGRGAAPGSPAPHTFDRYSHNVVERGSDRDISRMRPIASTSGRASSISAPQARRPPGTQPRSASPCWTH